jgi:hypothetical protein
MPPVAPSAAPEQTALILVECVPTLNQGVHGFAGGFDEDQGSPVLPVAETSCGPEMLTSPLQGQAIRQLLPEFHG